MIIESELSKFSLSHFELFILRVLFTIDPYMIDSHLFLCNSIVVQLLVKEFTSYKVVLCSVLVRSLYLSGLAHVDIYVSTCPNTHRAFRCGLNQDWGGAADLCIFLSK